MPMLGIMASGISGNLLTYPLSAYDFIASGIVTSGGNADITFSSIPQTYSHLQIRGIANSTAGSAEFINMQVGNTTIDTGTNYTWHQMYGTNVSAGSGGAITQSSMRTIIDDPTIASFATFSIDILDYANTNKYKTTRTITGMEGNSTTSVVALRSGLWLSTSAIDTIKFTPSLNSLSEFSSFYLYGIR